MLILISALSVGLLISVLFFILVSLLWVTLFCFLVCLVIVIVYQTLYLTHCGHSKFCYLPLMSIEILFQKALNVLWITLLLCRLVSGFCQASYILILSLVLGSQSLAQSPETWSLYLRHDASGKSQKCKVYLSNPSNLVVFNFKLCLLSTRQLLKSLLSSFSHPAVVFCSVPWNLALCI